MPENDHDTADKNDGAPGRSRPGAVEQMDVDDAVAPSPSTAPPESKSDSVKAESLHGGDDDSDGDENPWMVHPKFGAPVCVSAMHPHAGNECRDCKRYIAHVSMAYHDDDVDIRAAVNEQDDIIARNRRTEKEAMLRGRLAVTERTLEDANGRIEKLTNQVIGLSAKCARVEQDRQYYFEDRERYRDELEGGRDRQHSRLESEPRRPYEGSRRKRGPPHAHDQQEGEPLRKRPTVVLSTAPPMPASVEIIVKSRAGWDVEEVKNLLVACDEATEAQGSTPPPGHAEPYGELLFHSLGLPWPDKQLNMIQDKLILIKDIPMPPAFGSSSFWFFNFTVAPKAVTSPPRGTAFSCGGGYRGRGGGFVGRGRGFGPRTVVTGATAGMLPQAMYPAPPPYAQQQPASTTATAAVTSTAPGSTQQPTPQPQLAPAAYWHGNAPTAAPSYSGVSLTPALHALQQEFNTATLFAPPDTGLNYPSTSSVAFMPTTLSHAPAAFHGGNDALHTPFSALGFEYLPTSSDLNLPPR
ncbi:hypothetical protein MSAN_00759100 [Mycena sanguinolenta]|uniref:Uncharacterized protein n=1 Tax=Mycena sanguinolenta TaxID=230812 RepID=A0A8H6Z599_9AGAR|nr:hypothetical protein MSAN_00759100 [Mycena sanguinolenta]